MGALVLRSDLVTNVREMADVENSQKVTDAEIGKRLDSGAKRLYEMLISARGAAYYAVKQESTVLAGSVFATLPADFFQLLSVAYSSSGTWLQMRSMGRNETAERLNAAWYAGSNSYRYALGGTQSTGAATLNILPIPTVDVPLRIDYVPTFLAATSGGQPAYDGIDGWEEWVVIRAAMFCVAKEERDVEFLAGQLASEEARIRALAADRDRGEPPSRIRDVYEYEDCPVGIPRLPWR